MPFWHEFRKPHGAACNELTMGASSKEESESPQASQPAGSSDMAILAINMSAAQSGCGSADAGEYSPPSSGGGTPTPKEHELLDLITCRDPDEYARIRAEGRAASRKLDAAAAAGGSDAKKAKGSPEKQMALRDAKRPSSEKFLALGDAKGQLALADGRLALADGHLALTDAEKEAAKWDAARRAILLDEGKEAEMGEIFGDLSDVSVFGEKTPAQELEESLLDACGIAPKQEAPGDHQPTAEGRQSGRQSRMQHGGTGDEESPQGGSPGSAASAGSSGSGPWLRVSGDPELMEHFRRQLARRMPGTKVYEACHVQNGLVHKCSCAQIAPGVRASHLLCECATELRDEDDRLIAGSDGKLHTSLHCRELKTVMQGQLLRWCPSCTFNEGPRTTEEADVFIGETEEY